MSTKTIGTCSLCGGAVTVPDPWMGVTPPTPTCSKCNAVPAHAHGPTIPMVRPTRRRIGTLGDFEVWEDSASPQYTWYLGPQLGLAAWAALGSLPEEGQP